MPYLFRIFITLFFISRVVCTLAQSHYAKHYTMKDGLAGNHVYKPFQDSKGFIWFTTDNGISRFDGREFRNFTSKDGLPDNDIFSMAEDATGRLWLTCFNGQPCYIKDSKVYTAASDTLLRIIKTDGYFEISRIGKRLFIILHSGKEFYQVNEDGKITALDLNFMKYEMTGSYFMAYGRDNSYVLYTPDLEKLDSMVLQTTALPGDLQGRTCPLGTDTFGIRTGHYLKRYTVLKKKLALIDSVLIEPGYADIWHDGAGLWGLKFGSALVPLTPRFTPDSSRDSLFINRQIWSYMKDREGNIWGGTFGMGVFMNPANGFKYHTRNNAGASDNITAMTSYSNRVYLASSSVIKQLHDGKIIYSNTPALSFRKKIDIMNADSNYLYAGCADEVLQVDLKSGKVRSWPCMSSKYIELHGRGILVGSAVGCFSFDFATGRAATIYNQRTTCAKTLKNGQVLVGTMFGLYRCTKNSNGHWSAEPFNIPGLNELRISLIGEVNGMLAVGTVQKGLLLIKGNDYEYVDLGEPYSDINCRSLAPGRDNVLWLASFSGLFRISMGSAIHQYTVENIGEFNGLPSNEVNSVAVVKDSVYVAGPEGLCSFSDKAWRLHKSPPPPLYISGLAVNSALYIPGGSSISLPPDSNNLELRFSAPDFKSMGNTRFKYRLPGLNSKWQHTPNNFIRFESLAPGSYTLELWAMNSQNTWTKEPLFFYITILPHWWQSAWFRLLAACLLMAAGYFIIRRVLLSRHKKELEEAAHKRLLIETELKAIKAQINPHFIFNTLNAIQYFLSNGQSQKAEIYLNTMAALIRKTLDFSNRVSLSLDEEIGYLRNYLQLESLRFDENFSYEIRNSIKPGHEGVEIPSMVLQPHIENSLRHGLKGKLKGRQSLLVSFSLRDNRLVCEVKDNGVGRQALKARQAARGSGHFSLGSDLSRAKLDLYEKMNGKKVTTRITDLYEEDATTPAGTLVTITLEQ